jgi:glucokinase
MLLSKGDMARRAVLGIDIGGTKTLLTLVNESFRIIGHVKFKTAPAEGKEVFLKNLFNGARELSRLSRKQKLHLIGAGAAIAGLVDFKKRVIEVAPNVLFLKNFALGRAFQREVHLDCVVGNDVQLALYAEHQLGAAVGKENVLGVFFGTGVAGAAIINGRVYRGSNGHGGQVGAVLAHSVGGAEAAESHGMIDRIASKAAIGGAALALGVKQWAPHLYKEVGTDLSKVSWGALARARTKGDKPIEELIRARMRAAGVALSSVVNFLNPEMVVLGGGLTEEMPRLILSEVEAGLREYLVPEVSRALKVKAAKFGNKAGAIGAAKLAFKKLG